VIPLFVGQGTGDLNMGSEAYAGNPKYETSTSDQVGVLAPRGVVPGSEARAVIMVNGFPRAATPFTHIGADSLPQYETRRWPYLLITPLLYMYTAWAMLKQTINRMCRTKELWRNSFFSNGLGPVARTVKECAGQWKALDIIYNYKFGTQRSVTGLLDDLWAGSLTVRR